MIIPKLIHIVWDNKDILSSDSIFVRNCIGNVVDLSPGWHPIIYDDNDVDQYLKDNLDSKDYSLIKDKHIVEKSDVWRLIKIYKEGGVYVDIDRLCNTSLNDIVRDDIKVVLPTCVDLDFSQDFICSAPENPMFLDVLKLNLLRRSMGIDSVYVLGPQTYFHGITKSLFGESITTKISAEDFNNLRKFIEDTKFISTYREEPPYNTILYRPENPQIDFDHEKEKRKFYSESNIRHWTGEW